MACKRKPSFSGSTFCLTQPNPGARRHPAVQTGEAPGRAHSIPAGPAAPNLGWGVPHLQQDLVVQWFPKRVVCHGHCELCKARDQVLRHPLLERLFSSKPVFQLLTVRQGLSNGSHCCLRKYSMYIVLYYPSWYQQAQKPRCCLVSKTRYYLLSREREQIYYLIRTQMESQPLASSLPPCRTSQRRAARPWHILNEPSF